MEMAILQSERLLFVSNIIAMQLTGLDTILAAFEEELNLERELGTRLVDCDRGLLVIEEAPPKPVAKPPPAAQPQKTEYGDIRFSLMEPSPFDYVDNNPASKPSALPTAAPHLEVPQTAAPQSAAPAATQPPSAANTNATVVLLHHAPLSPAAKELMHNIRTKGLKMSEQEAPFVYDGPLPKADNYIIFGFHALNKWFPGSHASPGMRITTDTGQKLTVTYSPEYVIRFSNNELSEKKLKSDMWKVLKPLAKPE